MDAGRKQLADILNGKRILEVPYYQRAYVWKEDQWKRFLSDMEYISSTGKDYFLGSVILKQQMNGIAQYDLQTIIDGQQRFTTLALFFKSICLKTDDMETFDGSFTVRNKKEKTRYNAIRHSINDRIDFEKVMALTEDKPIENASSSKLIEAYNYFQANVNPNLIDVDTLINHIIFVGISLTKEDDEQVIFDTINSLGVRLTTGELLKNYFFTESTREEYEELWMPIFEKDKEVSNFWDATVNSGRIKRANIDFFFYAYLSIKIQDPIIKVSADHKLRYHRAEGLFGNFKDFISTYNLDKKDMIYDILTYAELYQNNINPDIAKGDLPGYPGLERINFLIFTLECTTLVPYVLFILKEVKDEEERNAIFGYIESYVLRRQICKSDNKNFSDLFAENLILNHIITLEALKDYIENKDETQALAIPSDKAIRNACRSNWYRNKTALSILYLIETSLREGKPHATKLFAFENYSLEHLMPKKWEDNWSRTEGITDDQRNQAVSCLGNLAMLPSKLNTSISNASWQTKKNGKGKNQGLLFYASDLETLSDAVTLDNWDENTISKRAEWMASNANTIWPSYLPDEIEDDEIEDNSADKISFQQRDFTHDYTKFSLNGHPATSKKQFVLDVVRGYLDKYPSSTYKDLKKVFHDGLCTKGHRHIGLLCTLEEYKAWENKYKEKRYTTNTPDGLLTSADNIRFYVNTQWQLDGMNGIIALAKKQGFTVKAETKPQNPTLFG